jgi:putative CocE/NonD family hydrolase
MLNIFMLMWIGSVNFLKWLPQFFELRHGGLHRNWWRDRLWSPATRFREVLKTVFTYDQNAEVLQPGFRRTREPKIENITAATFWYSAWNDLLADSGQMWRRLRLPAGRKQMMIGDGYHAVIGPIGDGNAGEPPRLDVLQKAWFDRWLKGIDNGVDKYGPVVIRRTGVDKWVATADFPRPGAQHRRLYLTADPSGSAAHAVSDGSLMAALPNRAKRLSVSPSLRTAVSRNTSNALAGVSTALGRSWDTDHRFAERAALTFSTAPVDSVVALSGSLVAHLNITLDAPNGFWSIDVTDVAPDGTSTIISHGATTMTWSTIDEQGSLRDDDGDYTKVAAALDIHRPVTVTPGQPTVLDLALSELDTDLMPGHRLRLDIAVWNIPRHIPIVKDLRASARKSQHVNIDPAEPSWIKLPIVGAVPREWTAS